GVSLEEALDGVRGGVALERDPARLDERVTAEGMVHGHRRQEPIQELEPTGRIGLPGPRHTPPERNLREDGGRSAVLSQVVPERDGLGRTIQQEPCDAEQVAGDQRELLRGNGPERAVQGGLRFRGIAPPERQEPQTYLGVYRERGRRPEWQRGPIGAL